MEFPVSGEKYGWFTRLQYGHRTANAYLSVAGSLAALQGRHFMRHVYLGVHTLRLQAMHVALDSRIFPRSKRRFWCGAFWSDEKMLHALRQAALSCSVTSSIGARVMQRHLIDGILEEFNTLLDITHALAVDVKLPHMLHEQHQALQAHKELCRAHPASFISPQSEDEQALFLLAKTDATYASALASGMPVRLSYGDAVELTDHLSQILAWEWLLVIESGRSTTGLKLHNDQPVHRCCLAMMLPNSVEYNMLWLASARSGSLLTLLFNLRHNGIFDAHKDSLLGRENSSVSQHFTGSFPYYSCSTALVSTSVSSNAMMYHALESAASTIVVLDAQFVPLLFRRRSRSQKAEATCSASERLPHDKRPKTEATPPSPELVLHVPPIVRRIYLWRWDGRCTETFSIPMRDQLSAFNACAHKEVPSTLRCAEKEGPPPLDLFEGMNAFDWSASENLLERHESSGKLCYLREKLMAFAPPGISCGTDSNSALTAVQEQCARVLAMHKGVPVRRDSVDYASIIRRQQLLFYRELSAAMARFEPTQPLLLIYTSGTTGLPKAARFSHIRFLSTSFLSRILRLREKMRDTLASQAHLPLGKATQGSGLRSYGLSSVFAPWRKYTADDLAVEHALGCITVYNCLPLYHSAGCVLCLGHIMHALNEQRARQRQLKRLGGLLSRNKTLLPQLPLPTVRMVIRTKFSATHFCNDLTQYRVTVAQYIGEMLRYAVNFQRSLSPTETLTPVQEDGEPATRLSSMPKKDYWRVPYAFGNGLRADIWLETKELLGVEQPVEFYSSTEGSVFLFNLFDIPGVIGHIPIFPGIFRWLSMQYCPFFPFCVLRFDMETQQVWRNPADGYCQRIAPGEVGEIVGQLVSGFDILAMRRFDGYSSGKQEGKQDDGATVSKATESKILRRVLWPHKNDAYFLSGDLLHMDDAGFCRFVDRIGDTFRWKGENVSTLQVSNAMQCVRTAELAIDEAVVYGVGVPGREGRAGMAKLSLRRRGILSSPDISDTDRESVESPVTRDRTAEHVKEEDMGCTALHERLMVQNDLLGILSGTSPLCFAGSSSQCVLPAYAIPLFLRVDIDEEKDVTAAQRGGSTEAEETPREGGRTSTFKNRTFLLREQGYSFATDCNQKQMIPSRVYVLVRSVELAQRLGCQPFESEGRTGWYVPLTPRTLPHLGERFEMCGW